MSRRADPERIFIARRTAITLASEGMPEELAETCCHSWERHPAEELGLDRLVSDYWTL